METYSDRRIETIVVKEFDERGLTTTDGWGWGASLAQPWADRIQPGSALEVEQRGTMLVGMRFPGEEWLYRKSDQDLEREHAEFVANFRRRNEETLEKFREDWTRREALLPEDLRARVARFREAGGHEFEVEGWGYELIICELVVLYRRAPLDEEGRLVDTDEVNEYARVHETSGNQHGVAKLITIASAAPVGSEPGMAPKDIPGGLTPLGASPDYGPRG